jgi:hypothetical protein
MKISYIPTMSIHSLTESDMRIAPQNKMMRLHRNPTKLAYVEEYESFFVKRWRSPGMMAA